MREPLKILRIGTFVLRSGHLRIADPHLDPGFDLSSVFEAAPGRWGAFMRRGPYKEWGERVWDLSVARVPLDPYALPDSSWNLSDFLCEVSTGQCAAVDDQAWPPKHLDKERLFETITWRLSSDSPYFIMSMGVFVSSGRGVGSYDVFTHKDDSQRVVAARVVFLHPPGEDYVDEVALELAGAGD